MKTIFITGVAGFIGMHTALKLLERGDEVYGIDNLNDYYSVKLKKDRLKKLEKFQNFHFRKIDLCNFKDLKNYFEESKSRYILHLAAQAGVRYSLENPHAYIDSNINGFINILELSRDHSIEHLVYASSSSVYGGNTKLPFSESDSVDHPVSLYAVTKKSNELMAHSYSHLFQIPTSGLRFFTVYGPWGRPDMALFLFTNAIFKNEKIQIFNNGNMVRDFTFIDDIVLGVIKVLDQPAEPSDTFDSDSPNPGESNSPYRIFNIGNSSPVPLMKYIESLEDAIGKDAKKEFLPMQPGDVKQTSSDTKALQEWIKFSPDTNIKDGIKKFVDWYKSYYKV